MKIECKNIKKSFGDNLILNFKSLIIESGEFLGIVGDNGSGKSTLLYILAALDKNYSGEVIYDGRAYDEKIQKEMSLVMQKPYMLKRTVLENLIYPLRLRNINKKEALERAMLLADKYGLSHLINNRADRLSGGEMQKANLARAEILKPRFLMLDEPTANIDREYTEIIEKHLLNYYEEYKPTIVLVTHSKEQAEKLCKRQIYLKRGKEYEIF